MEIPKLIEFKEALSYTACTITIHARLEIKAWCVKASTTFKNNFAIIKWAKIKGIRKYYKLMNAEVRRQYVFSFCFFLLNKTTGGKKFPYSKVQVTTNVTL